MEILSRIVLNQIEAALAMLHDALATCPPEHWDGPVGKYPFWQVAYHTLCFVDLYLSPSEAAFEIRAIHPQGMREYDEEYPSRRFEQAELLEYACFCRDKARIVLAAETPATLAGPSGHSYRKISRGELHVYNLRHLAHHTGQISAYLRRADAKFQGMDMLRWVSGGWPA